MHARHLHDWNLEPKGAVALQQELRSSIVVEPLSVPVTLVAGCDLSFDRGSDVGYAGIVVIRLPELEVVDSAGVEGTIGFPYIPGLLSFRESPLLLRAWERLRTRPDAVMIDGHGLAHPRRFGIACHFGLLVDVPTVGCAKSVLVGAYEGLADEPGAVAPLIHAGESVGVALRTKRATAPIFVSVGHRTDLASAVSLAMACRTPVLTPGATPPLIADGPPPNARYRIPEPTRQAHLLVNEMRRGSANVAPLQ
jgi:deoxyribonuclease V